MDGWRIAFKLSFYPSTDAEADECIIAPENTSKMIPIPALFLFLDLPAAPRRSPTSLVRYNSHHRHLMCRPTSMPCAPLHTADTPRKCTENTQPGAEQGTENKALSPTIQIQPFELSPTELPQAIPAEVA